MAALGIALLLGCSADDTEIVGACVPDGDAVRLVSAGGSPQPGLLDGNLLLAWVRRDGSGYYAVEAAWFGTDLSMTSTLPALGRQTTGLGTIAWVRDGDALAGQGLLGTNATGVPEALAENALRVLRVGTAGATTIGPIALPISHATSSCSACSHISGSGALLGGGYDTRWAALARSSDVMLAVTGVPGACDTDITNADEPILFTTTRAALARTRPLLCQVDPHSQPDSYAWPNNIALVRGGAGMIGMLFRRGETSGLGNVHYVLTDETGNTMLPPVQVGPVIDPVEADVGWDLHGVTLGEVGGVVYRERTNGDLAYLTCYRMRTFHGDGRDANDTPFQVGCFRHQDQYVTRSMDLVELGSGDAVVIWGERTAYGGTANLQQTITSSTPWSEGIYMAMLTPSGRRGSQIVRVTPPEATMLGGAARTASTGPFPGDFAVRATSEGDHVVVTWTDTRPDAPGIYARSYRCRRSGADGGASSDAGP